MLAIARALTGAAALILFFVAAPPLPTAGQAPMALDPTWQFSQYAQDVWQMEEGLPQNTVNSIIQTHDGYLWLGTQNGVARFNGVAFTVFDKTRVDAFLSNQVMALLEDRSQALWIGTRGGGLVRFQDGQFTSYTKQDGLSSNNIKTLYEDENGTLWIGTIGGGLNRFDGESFTHYTTEDSLPGSVILSITEGRAGSLWVGTEAGLAHFRDGHFAVPSALAGRMVRALHLDENEVLWAGTDQGLTRIEEAYVTTYTREDGLSGNDVSALHEDAFGALWISTLDGGLCRLYRGQFSAFTIEDGLTHNRVRTLFQDREGSLWIGTEMGGLNRLRMRKFKPISTREGLSNDVVFSVLEDREGTLWVGTDGGGLNRVDESGVTTFTKADGLPSNQVVTLYEDHRSQLWAGTFGGGLCRLIDGRFDCLSAADGLSSNYVFALYGNAEGDLWVGTNNGLSRLHDGEVTAYTTGDGLSSGMITSLLQDQAGNLWIGTYGGGLSRFHDGRFVSYGEEEGLSSDVVLALYEGSEGALWVGTQGGGLCRQHEDGSFSCFDSSDGLLSDDALQIQEDDQNHLWLGTLNGIARISKKDLYRYGKGQMPRLIPTVYNTTDGLKSSELNGGTQPASWKGKDGRLYFSTIRGVAVVNPADIPLNTVPPKVKLESFRRSGELVDLAEGPLTLPAGSQDVEFYYTGLNFMAPQQMQFQYKLEGYDVEWKDAGTRREAFYTNLSPGDYTFSVQARNSDGTRSMTSASIAFSIEPFFYQTYWFYLLCALTLVLTTASAYRWRVRHLQARKRELARRIENQTARLRKQKQQLEILNENLEAEVQVQVLQKLEERSRYEQELIAAKEQAEESARLKSTILTNISHEIRTPISGIIGYAQILVEELDNQHREFAGYIQENAKRLMSTMRSILDLSKIESNSITMNLRPLNLGSMVHTEVDLLRPLAERKELALQTCLPSEDVVAHLDEAALARILQNLVENAVKFTFEGTITVEAGVLGNGVYVKVRDTGIGIGKEFLPDLFGEFKQESTGLTRDHQGSGLGLAITKRLVEAMNGTISVESEKNRGTTFTATFRNALAEPEQIAPADAQSG